MPYVHKIIGNPDNKFVDIFLAFLLVTSIVGFLTIKKWTNTCLFLLLFLSILYLKQSISLIYKSHLNKPFLSIILIFSLPILAILFSQFGRNTWLLRAYDAPSRIFLCIPILFFFIYKRINYSYLINTTAPLTIFVTLISIYLHPEAIANWEGRYATTFVDPNTLGTYSVLFTSFCLLNIDLNFKSSKIWSFYQFSGVILGIVIIVGNGTRGSWIALPLILTLWVFFNYRQINKLFFFSSLCFVIIFLISITKQFPNSLNRILALYSVLMNWDNFSDLDYSVHLRISMWKTSWQLFLQNPILGYGDNNLTPFINESLSPPKNTPPTTISLNEHGPHNELLANALRSGFLGVISVLSLFIIPLSIFINYISNNSEDISRAAKLGMIYIVSLAICSMTLEVFNLKYTSSFYGLIISGLVAQILNAKISLRKT